jgi:flavodoxin
VSSNILVAYFSASGETRRLAKTFAEAVNGELYEIKPAQAYSSSDLDWNDRHSRSSVEMGDENARPAITDAPENLVQTQVILLFPIWWYQAPRIIQTFLERYDFSGKTVIPVCTSGGSSMGKTEYILKKSCSADTRWIPGKRFSSNAGSAAVKAWVDSLGLPA